MKKWTQSALHMGTVVTLTVATSCREADVMEKMARAFRAFSIAEKACSRFDADSEVRRLALQAGVAVQVSDLLFEAVRFALAVAETTGGAFDPTVGGAMEAHGFDRHYLTGEKAGSGLARKKGKPFDDPQHHALSEDCGLPQDANLKIDSARVQKTSASFDDSHHEEYSVISYRDVVLDEERRTIQLLRPLLLDLGAVAKGLGVDLAAKELREFEGFVVEAGGDLYAGGRNEHGEPWLVGVQHPERKGEMIGSLRLTDAAVCTSGSYERIGPNDVNTHHLLDPKTGASQRDLVSCTVVAPFAMMADAFSTAAFVLGREKGVDLLQETGLEGLLITPALDLIQTNGWRMYLA